MAQAESVTEYLARVNASLSGLPQTAKDKDKVNGQTPDQLSKDLFEIRKNLRTVIKFVQNPQYDENNPNLQKALSDLKEVGVTGLLEGETVEGQKELAFLYTLQMDGQATIVPVLLGPNFLSEKPSDGVKVSLLNRLLSRRRAT